MQSFVPPFLIEGISFVFGALVGSFLNVCILRIPEDQSVVYPGSHCPACSRPLRWFDNIPLISFMLLKGRCRDCHQKISIQYPLIELLSGLMALACSLKFVPLGMAALWFLTFVAPLLVISIIDLRLFLIPDMISLPFIGVGLVTRLFSVHFHTPFLYLLDSFYGILLGAGGLWLIAKIYELIQKREGLGLGDVKLAAMIGAFLGWKALLFVFVFSSLLGSVVGIFLMIFSRYGLRSAIPYGPFLSFAAVTYLFEGERLWQGYLHWVYRVFH